MINIETYDINDISCQNYSIKLGELLEYFRKIRRLTKTAKSHVIKILKLKSQKLERKLKTKGEESSGKQLHKHEEIKFLEKADLDTLTKRVFTNKFTSDDLGKLGDKLSVEDRVIVRLFSFNQLNKELSDFRNSHEDWEDLVNVLLYRSTCGKMKVNKTKKKKDLVPVPLPYGIATGEINNDESKAVFVTPSVEIKSEKTDMLEKRKKQKAEKTAEIPPEPEIEQFDISEEKLTQFVQNEDDLDDWERDIDNFEDDGEFNLMTPINAVEKSTKHYPKNRPVKRKASFQKGDKVHKKPFKKH